MTRWSRKCSCRRIHSMPSTLREANLVSALTSGPKIKECEAHCFEKKPCKQQWQPMSCRRRVFGRITSPIGGELPDFNTVPLLTEQEIDDSTDFTGLGSLTPNVRQPFQLIPASRLRRRRPGWSQFLKLLLVIVSLVLLILGLKRNSSPLESVAENPSILEKYRCEIEALKQDFPGQSGWLWFIINTLALDLIGQPAYQSDDQIRSVVFGVPQNSEFSGWCLAWELTKVVNRIGSSLIHPPTNFSFADIYCLDDCRRSKKPNNIARSGHENKMAGVRSILREGYTAEDRLNKIIAEALHSGQTALFINHLQAAPRAGLDLLIRPRRRLSRHKSGPLGSLRLIFYMVHLPAAGKSQVWTVSKVRDYIVSLWPDLEPEVELLLKTRLVGHVVLVRPFLP